MIDKTFYTISKFRYEDKENVERGKNNDVNWIKYMHYKMTPTKSGNQWSFVNCYFLEREDGCL